MDRRDFLKGGLAAGGLAALGGGAKSKGPVPALSPSALPAFSDPMHKTLADIALAAATEAGASYADIRIADYRSQSIRTREAQVQSTSDSVDSGFGIRVIAKGTWGFAASARIDEAEVVRVAKQAVKMAEVNAVLQREPLQLAPVAAHQAIWNTPIEIDPFEIPLLEKAELLLAINAEALKVDKVSFCSSTFHFVKEHKFFASTEGSYIEQTLHRCNPRFTVTSVDRKKGGFETRNSYTDPTAQGYEYIKSYPWMDDVRRAGEDAVEKHSAKSVVAGKHDLILHPSHLWLTIHESIGHPTELDRAMGLEANYAGTSFLTPEKMGKFQLASEIVNFNGEKTAKSSLASCGYDDDGVKTMEWPMVKDGIFVDYQTTREQAAWIGHDRSYGTCYAQSWKDVPFQRMPNINLLPGKDPLSFDALVGSTDSGILIKGRGSYSIDHQRKNFQFGGQTYYEIKGGKIVGMLRDVAYQSKTPEFWNSCDAICSKEEYYVGGSFYDGKGEPGQANAVSHGCSPSRFRQINVLNTGRKV